MGIELRMREPSADGVAPFLLCAVLSVGEEAWACRAGVSRTSLRNWELFIVFCVCGLNGGGEAQCRGLSQPCYFPRSQRLGVIGGEFGACQPGDSGVVGCPLATAAPVSLDCTLKMPWEIRYHFYPSKKNMLFQSQDENWSAVSVSNVYLSTNHHSFY